MTLKSLGNKMTTTIITADGYDIYIHNDDDYDLELEDESEPEVCFQD